MKLTDTQNSRIESLLYEIEEEDEYIRVLSEIKDKNELHELARNTNWDGGYFELNAIIDHQVLDKGTALLLYWFGEPEFFAKYKDSPEELEYQQEGFQLVKRLENMLLNRTFVSNEIRFDPVKDRGLNKIQEKKLKANEGIPEVLKRANIQA